MSKILVLNEHDEYSQRFRTTIHKTDFKINVPSDLMENPLFNGNNFLEEAINELCEQYIKRIVPEGALLGLSFKCKDFSLIKNSGYLSFRPIEKLNALDIWSLIIKILQSNQLTNVNSVFEITLSYVCLPTGSGRKDHTLFQTYDETCHKRKGIVYIVNNRDNLCLARALIVARIYCKDNSSKKDQIRKAVNTLQKTKALNLIRKCGLSSATTTSTPTGKMGLSELAKFQAYLKQYEITVFEYATRTVIFAGGNYSAKYKINLLHARDHFSVIVSLTAALACRYFCDSCNKPYTKRNQHICDFVCSLCHHKGKCLFEKNIICTECNRNFISPLCYTQHKQTKVCEDLVACPKCYRIIRKNKVSAHVCGEYFCVSCRAARPRNHLCFMAQNKGSPLLKGFLFIFFDVEATQEIPLSSTATSSNPSFKHRVNLLIYEKACYICHASDDSMTECKTCGKKKSVLYGDNSIKRFVDDLFELRKHFTRICAISHNGKAYDMQFLARYFLDCTDVIPQIILRGTKLLKMSIGNLSFIDSINYFPSSLYGLTEMFGLPKDSLTKGYFPHLFNKAENQAYKGPVPGVEFYQPETMTSTKRAEFIEWHNLRVLEDYIFDFKKELIAYCSLDVEILRRACLIFRDMFLKICKVDCFLEGFTLASICNLAFRRCYLKPNTIGLIPTNGYDNYIIKNKSDEWLSFIENNDSIQITRDIKIPESEFYVHGIYDKKCYIFLECYLNGCPLCFITKRDQKIIEGHDDDNGDDTTLQMRYETLKLRLYSIEFDHGFEVITMWSCQFISLKEQHKSFFEKITPSRINARDALFGGRTEQFKTHSKVETPGQQIEYKDLNSLYPFICKYSRYPVRHPKIFTGKDIPSDFSNLCGLIKCESLPPENLRIPVLPTRIKNKLFFTLCRKCAQDSDSVCRHTIQQRTLSGTWVIDEVRVALEKKYKIIKIFELWSFESETYDPVEKKHGIFTDYINTFLKLKQQASGFPSECLSDSQKSAYINEYYTHEGIQLEKEKIIKNPGLRTLAKLAVNCLWGRLSLKSHLVRSSVVRDSDEYFKFFINPNIQVHNVTFIGENVVLVSWSNDVQTPDLSSSSTNVVLSAFTTALARLKLYQYLDRYPDEIIYVDTDSVIRKIESGGDEIPTGPFLGNMCDELIKYGKKSFIEEFVCLAPKAYTFAVFSTNEQKLIYESRIKGITLNYSVDKILNFNRLKQMIFDHIEEEEEEDPDKKVIMVPTVRISRDNQFNVMTTRSSKKFRINAFKRKMVPQSHDTLPYGYVKRRRLEKEDD